MAIGLNDVTLMASKTRIGMLPPVIPRLSVVSYADGAM